MDKNTEKALTMEQQERLLHEAARLSGLDGHTQTVGDTAAERAMCQFGDRKDTPRKCSFLYLDAVDCCFYYARCRFPCCTFTAKWGVGAKDLDKLEKAAELIKTMLGNMQALADQEEGDHGTAQI